MAAQTAGVRPMRLGTRRNGNDWGVRILVRWLAFVLFWIVLAGEASTTELAAAALAGAAATVGLEAVRPRRAARRRCLGREALASLSSLPYRIVRDFVRLVPEALRPTSTPGEMHEIPMPPVPAGLLAVAGSVAANEVVIAVDERRRVVLVHRLRP